MKHNSKLNRSRWLLLTLFTLIVGISPAWGDAYTCGFESSEGWSSEKINYVQYTTVGEGWGTIGGATLKYYNVNEGSTYKRTGSQSLTHNGSSENTTYYAVTPYLAAGTISFYARYAQSTYNLKIYKASFDGENYTVDDLIVSWNKTGTKLTNSFIEYSFELDEDSYVAILLDRVAMDDFSAPNGTTTPSGIAKPKNFSVSNITANSADFSWSAGGEETEWEFSYSTTSGNPGSPTNGAIVPLTSTSYSLSGLTSETTYYASVRAKVGEEYSSWTKEISFTPTRAVKLTVNDGTTTNPYVPIYGNYVDNYDKVEFIIPASDLTDMAGSDIKALSFYLSSPASKSWGSANFKIYMKEVENTTISSYSFTDETPLYDGSLDGTKSQMDITLTNSYSYNGGNLLVGIYNTTKGTYASASFYGVTATNGASVYGNNGTSLASITSVNKQSFLPKTTFTYLPPNGAVMKVSTTALDFGTITSESTELEKTKTFTISNKGNATLENISVSYDGDNVFNISDGIATSIEEGGEDITVTVTMSTTVAGNYSGTITVSATDQTPTEISVTGTYSNSPATMAVTLNEEPVGASVAFGSVGKQVQKTFTVTNGGDQTLHITSIASNNTTDFTVSPATLEVAGHSSETFTVTFVYDAEALDAEKTATITVTASNEGIEAKSFTVTGTRIEQWSEDFSGGTLPDGWENDNTSGWTFADGVAKGHYVYGSSYYLTTPSLKVEATSDVLTFDYVATGNYVSVTIQKSKNGGAWESCSTATPIGSLNNGDAGTATITGLEAGNYKFRFQNDDYNLDNFQGFKPNANDPKMGIYSDAECTAAVATSVTNDFGFATTDQTVSYYIKNDGTGTMTLSKGDDPAGFTATLDKTSVAAGEHATLTITMPAADNAGYHSGNIVVTATDLGNFTVAASGVVVDENKLYLNFSSAKIPATWSNTNFTKNSTDISCGYNIGTLQTASLTAEANEQVVVRAMQDYTTSGYTFGVNYRKVGDDEWSELIAPANIGTSYVTLTGTITEAGNYELQFTGRYVHISHIYGLAEAQEPVMAVYDGESLAGASYDFGNVSNEADATWTLTVKNEGKAKITGLAAALSGTNAAHYAVTITGATGEGNDEIEADAQATITVKQLKDNLGSHEATLTISADDPIEDKVIALSGSTRDHTKLYVDFDNPNAMPEGWTIGSNWNIYTYGTDRYAYQSNTSTASSLITTPLTVAADETLKFQAAKYYSNSSYTDLKVRYTTNGGITWNEVNKTPSSTAFEDFELTGVPSGTVVVDFYGKYVKLDNLYGFTPTTAPMLSLTENAATVASESTKEFGNLTEDGVATYTLTNNGTADMVSVVSTTGVATAVISGEGEGITLAKVNDSETYNKVTLAAGKSATITLTVPFAAPYGEKSGAMTIDSEGWVGDMVVNYTATTIDPTAVYVDFEDNSKPAGWYNSGWTIIGKQAANYSQTEEKSFITSLLTVAGTDDVLTFDARAYYDGYTEAVTVSYSTDRKNWTPLVEYGKNDIDGTFKTFQVKGLAAGNYYLKISGLYVYLDNIRGWHYKTPVATRDLYIASATFPTGALIPETENGVEASVKVYSLQSNETGVYAKLFFDETLVATSATQTIAKDGNETLELTGNVPATENTYAAKIVVYYSDNSVAFETLTTNVEVAHTRTLSITEFTRDGEGEIDANASNQFSAAFNVTVQNTGSTAATTPVVKIFIGETEVGSATADAEIAAGESKEIAVNVTNASAGEGGELAFTAKAYWTAEGEAKATSASDVVITVHAAAPKFNLNYKDGAALADGDNVDYGLVKAATSKAFTISNTGTANLELVSIVAPEGYSATEVTEGNKNIAIDGSLDIAVTLKAEQGKKSGDLVITYKVDESTNKTFTLQLSGRSVAADTWTVAFDDAEGSIPANWVNEGNNWEISKENGSVYNHSAGKTLTTPRLTATAGEELTFDLAGANGSYPLLVEYSTDGYSWTEYDTYTTNGEKTFTAPAAGDYYIRFNGCYDHLSNFVGFKLATTVPVTISQYGYTTFASMSNINADELPDGIEVFYVKSDGVDGSYVRLTKAEGNIPAGTGLILKGTADEEYNLNIATGATKALEGNLMVGCLEATLLDADEESYVLVNNAEEERAEFQKLDKQGIEIPAGKAYLKVAGASARLMIFDDGETTGISSVLRQQARDGRVYNLNGQRVENPKKGQLYIINGKQTVVK